MASRPSGNFINATYLLVDPLTENGPELFDANMRAGERG